MRWLGTLNTTLGLNYLRCTAPSCLARTRTHTHTHVTQTHPHTHTRTYSLLRPLAFLDFLCKYLAHALESWTHYLHSQTTLGRWPLTSLVYDVSDMDRSELSQSRTQIYSESRADTQLRPRPDARAYHCPQIWGNDARLRKWVNHSHFRGSGERE